MISLHGKVYSGRVAYLEGDNALRCGFRRMVLGGAKACGNYATHINWLGNTAKALCEDHRGNKERETEREDVAREDSTEENL